MIPSTETTGEAPWKSRARRLASRVPWARLGFLAAIVTLGFSQIIFNVIQHNLDFYPVGAWFFASVIFYVQLLPLAALVLADALLHRFTGEGRTLQSWRAILITLLFLSLLRQAQVYYPEPFWAIMAAIPVLPVLIAVTLLVFLLAFRFHRGLHAYLAWMGILSVVLTGVFFGSSDAFARTSGASAASPPDTAPGKDMAPIVMIVFDELSSGVLEKDGEIDADRFPNFAALSKDSAWFSNATSNHLLTTEAFPTIFTGRLEPPDRPVTVFDRLPDRYEILLRLGSSASYNWIRRNSRNSLRFRVYTWEEEIIGSPLEVPHYLLITLAQTPFSRSPFAGQPNIRLAPPIFWEGSGFELNVKADVESFLQDLAQPSPGPRMVFWHSFLPHFPFTFDSRGELHGRTHRSFAKAPGSPDSVMLKDTARAGLADTKEYRAAEVYRNYRDQVSYVDRILGRVVAAMKNDGSYDRAILIVTSDHGLRTWGELEPKGYPEILANHTPRVPLFVRAPNAPKGKFDYDVQQMDLVATLLDVLNYPEDANDTDGISAFAEERPDRPKVFLDSFVGRAQRRYLYDEKTDVWRWTREE